MACRHCLNQYWYRSLTNICGTKGRWVKTQRPFHWLICAGQWGHHWLRFPAIYPTPRYYSNWCWFIINGAHRIICKKFSQISAVYIQSCGLECIVLQEFPEIWLDATEIWQDFDCQMSNQYSNFKHPILWRNYSPGEYHRTSMMLR